MHVWNVLHVALENTGRKKSPKIRHLRTIAQVCRAISSQLRHVSTIRRKLVKQQYIIHMSSYDGEFRSTNGWDRFVSLGHSSEFQRVSRLGSVTARHSSSRRQPNFTALNRGRHLYSAERPSHWTLAQILVMAALCNRGQLYFCPVVSFYLLLSLFSSPNLSGHRLDVYHTSTHGVALVRF